MDRTITMSRKTVDEKEYTDEEIENMEWNTKARLIKKDPVTVVRYFTNRYKQFSDLVINSHHKPIYQDTDSFLHHEFATCRSIHIHMFVFTEDAPKYGEDSN